VSAVDIKASGIEGYLLLEVRKQANPAPVFRTTVSSYFLLIQNGSGY